MRCREESQEWKKKRSALSRMEISLLALALAFVFIASYLPHFTIQYPIHIDEWQHIAQVISIKEGNLNWNPYFEEKHFDIEIAFHLLLYPAALLLGNFGFIIFYSFLPAIFAVLSGISIFFMAKRLFGSFRIGIFSVLFFGFLKSNVNILGIRYFTPMSAAIPLIYLFILLFSEAFSEKSIKKLLMSAGVFALIFLIHPPSATFLLPVVLTYFFLSKTWPDKKAKLFAGTAVAAAIVLSLFITVSGKQLFYFAASNLLFRMGWTGYELKYSLPLLYTIPATALAVLAVSKAIADKKTHIIVVLALLTTGLAAFFNLAGFIILAPYQRMVYYAVLFLAPLSALGLSELVEIIKKSFSYAPTAARFISAALVLGIFTYGAISSYTSISGNVFYSEPVADSNSFAAMKWAGEKYPGRIFMAPVLSNSAVYPVAGATVQSLVPAQLGTFDRQDERISDAIKFYASKNCTEMRTLLEKWNATVVLSKVRLSCEERNPAFLSEEYSSGYFVYVFR